MANEIRLRRNNMAGTITDNPLAQVSTTINSAGFVDLPTIGGTNSMILILDPLEINGPAEIVLVTAHTAAASSVTVTRGVEGSAPRAHIMGTTWFHGPVTSDWEEVLTSSTRPTIPYTGEAIYETDTLRTMRYNGTAWIQDGLNFDVPVVSVRRDAVQSLSNAINTTISWDIEELDTDGMWSPGTPTRITFTRTGVYTINYGLLLANNNVGFREANILWNGAVVLAVSSLVPITGGVTGITLSRTNKFTAADFIEARLFQNSGAPLDTIAGGGHRWNSLQVTWVGRGN